MTLTFADLIQGQIFRCESTVANPHRLFIKVSGTKGYPINERGLAIPSQARTFMPYIGVTLVK